MHVKKKLAAFLLVIVMTGCATDRLGIKSDGEISEEKIAKISVGVSTKGQIITIFGEPLDRLALKQNETFYYKDFNLKSIWIEFDHDGVVTGYTSK